MISKYVCKACRCAAATEQIVMRAKTITKLFLEFITTPWKSSRVSPSAAQPLHLDTLERSSQNMHHEQSTRTTIRYFTCVHTENAVAFGLAFFILIVS